MKKIIAFTGLAVIIVAVTVLSRKYVSDKKWRKTEGVVTAISEGGAKDAILNLEGNDTIFYINRGLERFTMNELRSRFAGKKVEIGYLRNRSLLSVGLPSQQIREIQTDSGVGYRYE
jgi:hypothetical protein